MMQSVQKKEIELNIMLRISGYVKESIVDGPGFRFVIFTQGCDRNCPDCHNPETHDRYQLVELFNN